MVTGIRFTRSVGDRSSSTEPTPADDGSPLPNNGPAPASDGPAPASNGPAPAGSVRAPDDGCAAT